MTRISGKHQLHDGYVDVNVNSRSGTFLRDTPHRAIAVRAADGGYSSTSAVFSVEKARALADALHDAADRAEKMIKDATPKPKTRQETIREYPVGTRFTGGVWMPTDYLRIGGDKVVAITSGRTYGVDSFLNELGTKDLKVVS